MTSRTFLASVSAIVNCGATPVFADVERDSQNISRPRFPRFCQIKQKLSSACILRGGRAIWIRSCNWLRIETFL